MGDDGRLSFTVDGDTTRYIDLNDPTNPSTSGANAGKNPQGLAIVFTARSGIEKTIAVPGDAIAKQLAAVTAARGARPTAAVAPPAAAPVSVPAPPR